MIKKKYLLPAVLLFLLSGCATVFKGYMDKVSIIDPPEDLTIMKTEGITIPCLSEYDSTAFIVTEYKNGTWVTSTKMPEKKSYYIRLRSNQQHILKFKSANFEKNIVVYPKLSAGWFILDLITVIPLFVDMYTGCWFHFDDIQIDSESQIIK